LAPAMTSGLNLEFDTAPTNIDARGEARISAKLGRLGVNPIRQSKERMSGAAPRHAQFSQLHGTYTAANQPELGRLGDRAVLDSESIGLLIPTGCRRANTVIVICRLECVAAKWNLGVVDGLA
jgi:hypothetical protein